MAQQKKRGDGLTVLEICAGAGGQSLGLEQAGFAHLAAVEIDADACATLRLNRPDWDVLETDVRAFSAADYQGVSLFAGGVPCPPFSVAGKQLGADDERDLFPDALRLIEECEPEAVLLENVKGFAAPKFAAYRQALLDAFNRLGYDAEWRILNASDYGVPQLRPRFVLVAMRPAAFAFFDWPQPEEARTTVGEVLEPYMAAEGWAGAAQWASQADGIGPTLVGGSKKHGGPDLGPTRARAGWLQLGVDGRGVANEPPTAEHPVDHIPKLTVPMAARIQGFPVEWEISGKKTAAYRQVGNAFPPPVARAVGAQIADALRLAGSGTRELTENELILAAA